MLVINIRFWNLSRNPDKNPQKKSELRRTKIRTSPAGAGAAPAQLFSSFFLFCAAPAQCRHNAGKLPALLQKNGCCASNSVWTEQKYSFKKPYATPAPSRYTEKRNGGSKCPLEYWKYSIIHSKSIKKLLAVCPYCVLRFFYWSWWVRNDSGKTHVLGIKLHISRPPPPE